MIKNPAWADITLQKNWDLLSKTVQSSWLPVGLLNEKYKELGCGYYGCVYATNDPKVVFKITSDVSEVDFIKLSYGIGHPNGVVKYYKTIKLIGTTKVNGRQTTLYGVWREAAENVGGLEGSSMVSKIFSNRITKFLIEADSIRNTFLESRNRSELLKNFNRLINSDWALEAVRYIEARDEYDIESFQYERSYDVSNVEQLVISFKICEKLADLMKEAPISHLIGRALRHYLDHDIILADTHTGNLGQVTRFGRLEWVITDPGNVLVL